MTHGGPRLSFSLLHLGTELVMANYILMGMGLHWALFGKAQS